MRYHQLDLGAAAAPPGGSLVDAPLVEISDLVACGGKMVVLDCETTGLYWWRDQIIGVAVWCPDADVRGYIPVSSPEQVATIREIMRGWSPATVLVNHNIKFDLHFLGIDPLALPYRVYDTMIMAFIYDSRGAPRSDGTWDNPVEERGSLSLDRLSQYFLNDWSKADYKALVKRNDYGKHHEWPLRLLSRYATDDARLTYELAHALGPMLRQRGQTDLLEVSMRYLGVIWRTERYGLRVDRPYLHRVRDRIVGLTRQYEQQLFDNPQIGGPFGWRSHEQLSNRLYERFGWVKPYPGKRPNGIDVTKMATSSAVLLSVAQHPLAPLIVQLRGLDKLRGYVDSWLDMADSDDLLHPSFRQTSARTGRLAASDPNTQQIPGDERSATAAGAFDDIDALEAFYAETNMRRAFIPHDGMTMMGIDYAQQEIRMFALLSGDASMLEAVSSRDVHAEMAYLIWEQRVNPWRDWAKTVSLGLMYGMGLERLSASVGQDAIRILNDYHQQFRGVRAWRSKVEQQIARAGFVTYWSGRRYYRSDERGYHKAVNALVQGGSADLLMHAVVDLHDWIAAQRLPIRIINYVHDEVDVEIAPEALKELTPAIQSRMEMADTFGVPFLTDVKVGASLGDLAKQ